MARPQNKIPADALAKLRELACRAFGKPLTHSFECELMSADIRKVTGATVSPQTLRRLFGFLQSDFAPAVRTLNILSVYAGFTGWHGVTERDAATEGYQPLTMAEEAGLYLDFYKVQLHAEGDMNYHNAARNMALRILANPPLLATLAPALARDPVAQVYFFERFPHIDGLCGPYRRVLPLYLQKKGREAQLFGNSLLFLSAWLSGDEREQHLYLGRLRRHPTDESVHPFVLARVLGSELLYARQQGSDGSDLLRQADHWNRHFLHKAPGSVWHFPYFQHMFSDYLNLAGLYGDSQELLRPVLPGRSKRYSIERGYVEALDVNWRLARHAAAPADFLRWSAEPEAFEGLSPLFVRFYRLQVACARYRLLPPGRKRKTVAAEIRELITATGFTRFAAEL